MEWSVRGRSAPQGECPMTARFNLLLAGALVFAILLSLMAGKVWIPLHDWASGDLASLIILELRLPRTLLGGAIGAALGIAGAVMQGYLRNPLADPGRSEEHTSELQSIM